MANVILPETTLELSKYGSYSNARLPNHIVLTDGVTYTVTYNGVNYVCKAFFDDRITSGVCLGNMDLYMGGDNDDGEPFVILSADLGMTALYDLNGNAAVTLSIIEGKTECHELPDGYKLLEYIGTNGTQYIDAGFKPNGSTHIVCEFMYRSSSEIYGARYSTSSANFALRSLSDVWTVGYGNKQIGTDAPIDSEWHTAEHNANRFYLDGELILETDPVEFEAPVNFILGGIQGHSSIYYGTNRYRRLKRYVDGKLVLDMVSCKNASGVAGMWDFVNGVFCGNAGTGEFIAGPEVSTYDETSFQIGLIMGLLSNGNPSITPSDTFDANSFNKGYLAGIGLR